MVQLAMVELTRELTMVDLTVVELTTMELTERDYLVTFAKTVLMLSLCVMISGLLKPHRNWSMLDKIICVKIAIMVIILLVIAGFLASVA